MEETAIIGAGPSGLALSAAMERRGIPHRVFEKERFIGGTYARIHPELTLVSPRLFSTLPFAITPLRKRRGLIRAGDYKDYLEHYAQDLGLSAEVSSSVAKIEPRESGHTVTLENGTTHFFRFVVLATGASSFPKESALGTFDDLRKENPRVTFETAREWKGADHYLGKTVLVLGSGTSATEIAARLAPVANVVLVTHDRFNPVAPKIFGFDAHFIVRPFEYLPVRFLARYCKPGTRDPAFDFGIRSLIQKAKLVHFLGLKKIAQNRAEFAGGERLPIDCFIQCTGYRFDTRIVSDKIVKNPDQTVAVKNNQSVSHPGFFTIGYPCSSHVDSKFLRGIRRDAVSIAKQIQLLKSRVDFLGFDRREDATDSPKNAEIQ